MAHKIFHPSHQLPEPERKRSYKGHIIGALLFTFIVTGAVLFSTVDAQALSYLTDLKIQYLFLALLASLMGIGIDSLRLRVMANLTGDMLTSWQSIKTLLGNYFFSFFTPGSSGGPIAQILLLRRFGISAGKATLFVITRTLCSIVIMILFLPILFYSGTTLPFAIPDYAPGLLLVLLMCLLALLFYLGQAAWFIRWSRGIIFIWSPLRFRRRLLALHQDLSQVALLFSRSPGTVLLLLVQTALSLTFSYSMIYFLFLGLNLHVDFGFILGRMFLINFLMHFAPTPGGSGIAEGLFLFFFSPADFGGASGIIAILWRILSEYFPAFTGFLVITHEFGYHYFKEKFLTPRKKDEAL